MRSVFLRFQCARRGSLPSYVIPYIKSKQSPSTINFRSGLTSDTTEFSIRHAERYGVLSGVGLPLNISYSHHRNLITLLSRSSTRDSAYNRRLYKFRQLVSERFQKVIKTVS